MAIAYKVNVLEELKNAGYSTYRIRKEKIFGERVVQQLRQNELVSWKTINTVCRLLGCQPGDLLEYVPDEILAAERAQYHVDEFFKKWGK